MAFADSVKAAPAAALRSGLDVAVILAAIAAVALPTLLAYNVPPSSTFLNQAAAVIGWGGLLALLALALPARIARPGGGLAALLAAFALLFAAALAAPLWAQLPWSLALSNAGMIAAAALAALVGAQAQRAGAGEAAFRALCIGLVVAGAASSVVGIVQVAAPQWADGTWIARSGMVGRAVGNLRQPNHLSSLLLWGVVAAVWLAQTRVLARWAGALLGLLFLFVVVLSGSRTGALSLGLLFGWGVLDRRLARPLRALLLAAPLAYAAFWFGAAFWADQSHQVFGAETRFSTQGDISSSRYAIWSNTLALIAAHPWTGVGLGEFNFAWTLTAFPQRPVAFFDHSHDLLLQFAAELGLPLALGVSALLLYALYRALRLALGARAHTDAAQAPLRRAAFMVVLLILVHSLLEYPLWYAYFLLPAAFAFGLCVAQMPPQPAAMAPAAGRDRKRRRAEAEARDRAAHHTAAPHRRATRPLLIASLAMLLAGAASVADYARVVVIFEPGPGAAPLAQRIAEGRASVLFSHHADYAAVTTQEHPSVAMASFAGATHYLLDARLMQAWATALHEAGDEDKARWVAQRLREFRNDGSKAFFAPCDAAPLAALEPAFQCQAPRRTFGFEDFR